MENAAGELECRECGSSVDLLKLTMTDMDGVVLDQQVICRACALDMGWEIGRGDFLGAVRSAAVHRLLDEALNTGDGVYRP